MEGFDAYLMLDHYRSHNRSIWAQELALTPAQAGALRDFLVWNQRPENRYYRYDYYRDNCSTRVRDALDRVLGGVLKATLSPAATGTTYRSHTRRLVGEDLASAPMYTVLEAGLGPAADRPINRWEEAFLPMRLRDAVRAQQVSGPGGVMHPLVAREQTLFEATRPPEHSGPPHWLLGYLALGLALGGALLLLGHAALRSTAARTGYTLLAGVWGLVTGLSGVALLGLWLLTDHAIAYGNINLFQLSPLALGLPPLLPGLLHRRGRGRGAVRLALVIAALSVLGVLVKPLPWFQQVNLEIVALVLPVHLALAWSAWKYYSASPTPVASS
jgi:hypothetical protein